MYIEPSISLVIALATAALMAMPTMAHETSKTTDQSQELSLDPSLFPPNTNLPKRQKEFNRLVFNSLRRYYRLGQVPPRHQQQHRKEESFALSATDPDSFLDYGTVLYIIKTARNWSYPNLGSWASKSQVNLGKLNALIWKRVRQKGSSERSLRKRSFTEERSSGPKPRPSRWMKALLAAISRFSNPSSGNQSPGVNNLKSKMDRLIVSTAIGLSVLLLLSETRTKSVAPLTS